MRARVEINLPLAATARSHDNLLARRSTVVLIACLESGTCAARKKLIVSWKGFDSHSRKTVVRRSQCVTRSIPSSPNGISDFSTRCGIES